VLIAVLPSVAEAQTPAPPATQLFFAPTGRTLPKGEGYAKVMELGAPLFQGGLTDRLSIGVGVFVPLVNAGVFVTPKFQLHHSESASTAVGTVHILAPENASYGMAYVAQTFEGKGGALHVAALAPYGADIDGVHTGFMIGGEKYLGPRATLITENYLLHDSLMISAGVRLRAARTTWDLGWMTPLGIAPGGPIVNFGWKF
jgi:hypothetical protein